MKITFLGIGSEQLGISQLSAIAKKLGHQTNIAFSAQLFNDRYNLQYPFIAKYFDDTQHAIETIKETQPDILAFGALTSTYQWGLEVARAAKKINPEIKIIFGGVHTSAVPHLVLQKPEVDYVVIGEADIAFPEILKNIENNDFSTPIINTQFKGKDGTVIKGKQGGFIQHLDSLPVYDKSIWEDYLRLGDLYITMATRGCPYRCTFCFNNFFAKLPEEDAGKYVRLRLRSVDHVIAELKYAIERYKIRRIDFEDDVFGTQKKWLREFAIKYKEEINIPFQILTHPKFMDEESAKLLSSAGCQWVQMGIQSMDDDFKKDTLLRYENSEDIARALEVMEKYKINVKVDHMFGLPNEPVSAQKNALALCKKYKLKRINTFWTCYLPGTQMMNEAITDGILTADQVHDINEGKDFYFYRNTENVKDDNQQKLYHAYEFIFKIIPILPLFIKRKIEPKHVFWIPKNIKSGIALLSDIITGFSFKNPVFVAYMYHNLFQLYRFIGIKFGIKNIKAVQPKTTKENNLLFPNYNKQLDIKEVN